MNYQNKRKIKVLYVLSTLERTGPTSQLLNIIKNLDSDIFIAKVITLSPEVPDSNWKNYKSCNIDLESLGLGRVYGWLITKKLMKKKLKEYKPDVIHTQGYRADKLFSGISTNLPRVLTQRNYPWDDYRMQYGLLVGSYMAYSHVQAIRKCTVPIACAKNIADKMKLRHSLSQVRYIQNGVDLNKFYPPSKAEKEKLREKYKIPQNQRVFLVLGKLLPRKNNEIILEVFLKEKPKDALLVVAGDGKEMYKLQQLKGAFPDIVLLGRVRNPEEWLKLSDYLVSSSLSEGLPNTVLEAMATGLPVILSNIEPHKEFFKNNYPFFFSPDQPNELRDCIRNIMLADYNDLSCQMKRIIITNFSSQVNSLSYQKIYQELCQRKFDE